MTAPDTPPVETFDPVPTDAVPGRRRLRDRLLYQIAAGLVLVAVAYAVLDIAIVVVTYSGDYEELGQDLVGIEAARVAGAFRLADGALEFRPGAVLRRQTASSTRYAYVVFDGSGREIARVDPDGLDLPAPPPSPELRSETIWHDRGDGFFITGTRRVSAHGIPLWITVAVAGSGLAPFLPVIESELVDHVLLPLLPLSIVLLLFNVIVVRHMMTPLAAAVRQVDTLDPSQMGRRIHVAGAPWEVQVLAGAINRALDRLEQAIRALRDFTADAAHELRTPVAIMSISIDQLPAGEARRQLRQDAHGMARLVDQMLDMAHVETLRVAENARADLSAIAAETVSKLLPLAVRRGRDIRFIDAGAATIRGDAGALGRALRNLIDNALLHTPEGTAVEVTSGPGPRWSVRDFGPGIAVDQRDRVVRRFWRADRREGGSGLGLAIVQAIVQAHDGRIVIDNAPGGGALVSLTFG
ncbi:MAG: HAMP domain-containing sensor histidine kinase [Rhizobiaceae bacterium]